MTIPSSQLYAKLLVDSEKAEVVCGMDRESWVQISVQSLSSLRA